MKVLFDCLLTSEHPAKCSTTSQYIYLAELLLQQRPDVFIYWPIPERGAAYMEEYPVSDRIMYTIVNQDKDRMREYTHMSDDLKRTVAFDGNFWDWDVLVTVRSPLVPLMRVHATSPRAVGRRDFSKKIVLIEDMMILSKKPTVVQSHIPVQDRLTIEGYLAADVVLIPAYHEKKWVMDVAKDHFSWATLRKLEAKLVEVCHLSQFDFQLKDEFKYTKGRKLNVAYVGRLERSNSRLEGLNYVFENQWVLHSNKVDPFICTVSPEGSPGETKLEKAAVKILRPNKKDFWRISKELMDLAVFYHVDGELLLSMLEPISFGVPSIVIKAPWSVGMLGEDYPFFVDTTSQGYAYVNAFVEDYDGHYAKFEKWFNEWFVPTYTRRCEQDYMYEHLVSAIVADVDDGGHLDGLAANEIIKIMVEQGGDNFVILDKVLELGDTHFRSLSGKASRVGKLGLIWETDWNNFRLGLQKHFGYSDASVAVGHLERVT